jgi:hypothetical protein
MFGYSNVTFDLDVYAPYGYKGSNIKIGGKPIDPNDEGKYVAPHSLSVPYSVAGYWYADDPKTINNCGSCATPGSAIDVVKDENGNPLDVSEIVVRYLKTLPEMTANPQRYRINLLYPLPAPAFENPEIQPLKGVIAN